jgi:hypothetical protein
MRSLALVVNRSRQLAQRVTIQLTITDYLGRSFNLCGVLASLYRHGLNSTPCIVV